MGTDHRSLEDLLTAMTKSPDFTFKLKGQMPLDRCPHCGVAKPQMNKEWGNQQTTNYGGGNQRYWATYTCTACGGMVLAATRNGTSGQVTEMYPRGRIINSAIPDRARHYLEEALDSLSNPSAAAITAASAVDAMLQAKGLSDGSLYSRIKKAATDNLITDDMAQWAHDIRLEANAQRHADEDEPLPDAEDARRCVDFAEALGEFLFVLPARVKRGREAAKDSEQE